MVGFYVLYFYVIFLMILCYLICTAIHEMGHSYFVRYTNNILIETRLGKGKRGKYLFKIGDLEVKRLFFFPGSRCVWEFRNWDNYRQDGVLISLGGCIANFLTLLMTLPIGLLMMMLGIKFLALFFLMISSVSGFQMVYNLIPIKGHDGDSIIRYRSNSKEKLTEEHRAFDDVFRNESIT
jgi:Zn-dependent protease